MKVYKFDGETFELDDSKGCFVTVSYRDEVAYLGVNLRDGSDRRPFRYAGAWQTSAQPDGLASGSRVATFEDGLVGVCRLLLERQQQLEFDREKACTALHDETAKLP